MEIPVSFLSNDNDAIELLGVRIHKVTKAQLLQHMIAAAQQHKQTIIANVNIRAMNLAYERTWFLEFLNAADIVFCDGVGVALGARLAGKKFDMQQRSTCPDWLDTLAECCSQQQLSLFFLGGEPGVAERTVAVLREKYPTLRTDCQHGYFDKNNHENQRIVESVNDFDPDILYVGFGMPLQEQWIRDNCEQLSARLILPLGACLDFYTGKTYRGPRWLTDHGLEWLSRLLTEPGRLWRRYVVGNPLFFWRVLKHHVFGMPIRS